MAKVGRRSFLAGGLAAAATAACGGNVVLPSADGGLPPEADGGPAAGDAGPGMDAGSPALDSGPQPQRDGGPMGAPNIIYIYFDQLRGDMIGALREHPVLTPTLDALAMSSVVFKRCFTNSPLCRPSRATMMTGHLPMSGPSAHGVIANEGTLASPMGPSHVRDLRDAGFHTMVIGKTHLTAGAGNEMTGGGSSMNLSDSAFLLTQWGFSESIELTGPGESAGVRTAWSDAIGNAAYTAFRNYITDYNGTAKRSTDTPAGSGMWNTKAPDAFNALLTTENHLDVWCATRAAQWIRDYAVQKPLYMQLNFPGPHSPFDATREFRAMYPPSMDSMVPVPRNMLPTGPTSLIQMAARQYLGSVTTADRVRAILRYYYAKVTMLDMALGRVIDALKAKGMYENSWIIVGGDHGDMLGSHSLLGKLVFLEPAIRIPLMIRPPTGTGAMRSTEALCDQLDVTATIRAIAGVPTTGDASLVGRSLLPDVAMPAMAAGKPRIVSEDYGFTAVRTANGKIVRQRLTPRTGLMGLPTSDADLMDVPDTDVELYDLANDPAEGTNVISSGDPAFRAGLIAQMDEVTR